MLIADILSCYTNNKCKKLLLCYLQIVVIIPSLTVFLTKHRYNAHSIRVLQRCCFVLIYSLFLASGKRYKF
ncbi:hypothetical protein CLOSTHATH_04088 [Hungatella hathewayi DSM 13479]|uniref:Uncharacterized protein n=1 Tax=Hungatella hathewayi DSM 13479 TaxID=566550 RepID=D3AKE5_9FIRM|nr:hypothetical protein CLOSTHATH_04088 [Hungatella hathewayi DSM 13479]